MESLTKPDTDRLTLDMAEEDKIVDEAIRIVRRRLKQPGQRFDLKSLSSYLKLLYAHRTDTTELAGIVLMDPMHRLLEVQELGSGTFGRTVVNMRDVVKAVLDSNAAFAVIFHTHPCQDTAPSADDVKLTRKVKDALGYIGVDLLDHIVVAGTKTAAFTDLGLL